MEKQEPHFDIVHYGQPIYLQHMRLKMKLWSRGFIDKKLYLSGKKEDESTFTIEPKKGLYGVEDKKNVAVVFGAEVLIKHSLSGEYISIKERDEIPVLQFEKEESPSCYFEFKPTRSFQSNGNAITVDSLFQIEHSERKLFISCYNEEQDEQSEEKSLSISMSDSGVSNVGEIFSRSEKREKQDKSRLDFSKKLKKKQSIEVSMLDFKKNMNFQEDCSSPVGRARSLPFSNYYEIKQEQILDKQGTTISAFMNSRLPIYQKEQDITICHIENQPDSNWKFQLYDRSLRSIYLQNNQFIYFIHSQENQVMVVDVEKKVFQTTLVKISNDHETQYLCSSIFLVQISPDKAIYLKHFLSGLYFDGLNNPLTDPKDKKRCSFIPLLPQKKKQYPPFRVQVEGEDHGIKGEDKSQLKKDRQKQREEEKKHGLWLNKVSKHEISEIMSLQNVSMTSTIRYLTQYLRQNTRRRQNILRQFQFIPYLIQQVIPDKNIALHLASPRNHQLKQHNFRLLKSSYQLLFFIIKNNHTNKKKCLTFLEDILKEHNKELILDLLTQLLTENSNQNPLQKYIVSDVIEKQLKQFILAKNFSISFMRIFRVFCGAEHPCTRNQSLLFKLFFWAFDNERQEEEKKLTDTVFRVQKEVKIPEMYKFRIFEKEGDLLFYNGEDAVKYEDLREQIRVYIRQYFYLLSDCINNNYPLIRSFTKEVSMDIILKLLEKPQMKGPALSLLYNAYLKPQRNFKSNIFHKDYQKICEKGSLMALTVGEEADRLIKFILKELNENNQYSSTTFRLLLNVFKMTIENGYWRNFEELLDVSKKLQGINIEPERDQQYHSSYEDKVSQRNLMKSKITSISISISLIEMQVSLWTSNFLSEIYTEKQIEEKIVQSIKQTKDWVIDQNLFKLCSTNSPELMRKSLLLLYKIYNLQKISYKTYEEASKEKNSSLELLNIFATLQRNFQEISIQDYFSLISACIKDVTMDQLLPLSMSKGYRNVQSLFKYKQVNEEVQIMIYKLGIHQKLIKEIKRFIGLRQKQKQSEEEIIYWKLLLVYAMIRNNLKLRDIMSQHRKAFISILQTDKSKYKYYVAADILEEIYRNNRKLIISDNQQLKQICHSIGRMLQSSGQMDLKYCKIVNLLGIFIETGNRKIVENHQLILKIIFTKDVIKKLKGIMNQRKIFKEQENTENKQHFRDILQILIYDLMSSMGQKKFLREFQRPSNTTINSILLGIGNRNWNLKSKVFSCINFNEQMPQKLPIQFMRLILYDLNIMCESIKTTSEEESELSKQVKIYISNMIKILDTIDLTFSYIIKRKNLDNEESQQVTLMIKIIERLYVIKSMCPLVVRKKIKQLKIYMQAIQNIIDKANLELNLIGSIEVIELADFQKSEIKEKLPLLYNEKIKQKLEKKKEQRFYDQSKDKVEMQLVKKNRWNTINTEALLMRQSEMKELQTFLVCMSNVNKSDSTVLSDNIKDFLMNFLRTSFLPEKLDEDQELRHMQDILVDYEIPSVICSILEEPFKQRYKLFCSTFALANRMLEGGHTRCQQRFLKHFRQDSKNWIFQNIHSMLHEALKTIEFYYHYEDDPTIKSYEMMLEVEEVFICKEERRLSCTLLSQAFRFLQLLCQNDNHLMKEYIYNQTDKEDHIKYMSKNFIQDAQLILDGVFFIIDYNIKQLRNYPDRKFAQEIKQNIFYLPNYILDFLIEVCQIPAEQNQLYLCRTDFFDFITHLMDLKKDIKNDDQEIFLIEGNIGKESFFFQIERKLVILFRGLLEQNSQEIIDQMRKKIGGTEFQFFVQESFTHGGLEDMEKLRQMMRDSIQLNSYLENIVDVLIVKKILKNDEKFNFDAEQLAILDQLNSRIQSIHVDFKGHALTVYFPHHPLFSLLTKKTKDYILDRSANLNTRKEKVTEYLISRSMVYEDINQEKDSQKRLMNDKKMRYLFNFALALCYIIIFFLVLFYSVDKQGAVLDVFENKIIKGLSIMEFTVCAIYTVLLGFNIFPIISEKMKTNLKRKMDPDERIDVVFAEGPFGSTWRLLKALYIDEIDSAHATILFIISFYSCWFEVRAYSFALLFVFARFQILQSIFKAIRLTWQQLAFVCLLALAFSFIFGFITLNNYIGPLYQNQEIDIDIDQINEHCNSIVTCISSLYTQKIIGESVSDDQQYNYGRFVSDLIYWGFFEILLSNMIAAIIIDKFAEQRNVKQKIYNDRYSKCYICFADRSILERRGEDFYSHVTNVHSLWNYFYYMYTLENLKHITEFTGIEYWINRQIKSNLIDWMPIDDSLKEENNSESAEQLLAKLKPLLMKNQNKDGGMGIDNSLAMHFSM